MAAAKAIDRAGGMIVVVVVVVVVPSFPPIVTPSSHDDDDDFPPPFLSSVSTCAMRSLHAISISGIAIRWTGVGPSINPSPRLSFASPTTASTSSVNSPSLDHSNEPSTFFPLPPTWPLFTIVAGRESSKDDRGARKGDDDLEAREAPPSAAADGLDGVEEVVE